MPKFFRGKAAFFSKGKRRFLPKKFHVFGEENNIELANRDARIDIGAIDDGLRKLLGLRPGSLSKPNPRVPKTA
jgi:hypothetical protein